MHKRQIRRVAVGRCLAILAILIAALAPAAGPAMAARQAGGSGLVSEFRYESPQFDFDLEWDDPWEVAEDRVVSEAGSYDQIVVTDAESDAELEAVAAAGIEPEIGLGSVIDSRAGEADAEVVSEDAGDGYVAATLAYDGPDGPVEEYVESQPVDGRAGNPDGALTLMVRAPAGTLELTWLLVQGTFLSTVGQGGPLLLGVPMTADDTNGDPDSTETPEVDETPALRPDPSDGIEGDAYTSPTYGYSLEWDGDIWQVAEDQGGGNSRDVLRLDYIDGGFLIVEGYDDYDGDPEDCLDGSSAEVLDLDAVEDSEPLEDRRGDAIEGEEDGVAFIAYTLDLGTNSVVGYFTCQTLVEDEAVLAFSLVVPEDVADTAIDDLVDFQETLDLDAQGQDEGNRRRPRLGGDETPTPRASQSGESYVSEENGWSVKWDEADWSMGDEPNPDGDYELRLNSDFSTIDFTVYDDYDGDAMDCMDDQVSRIETGTFDEVEAIEEISGDDELASAVYFVAFENSDGDDVEVQTYLECRTLVPGETVLNVFLITAPEDYDDEIELLEDVLDTIETPEARAA